MEKTAGVADGEGLEVISGDDCCAFMNSDAVITQMNAKGKRRTNTSHRVSKSVTAQSRRTLCA
jgi:hypothetical protein